MTSLSWDQVLSFRLERQFLGPRAPAGGMLDVARALCGIRAQLASTAELGLWARVEGLEQGDVKAAVEDERTLVKTWSRGQLYLFAADDLDVHVAALFPRPEGPGDAWLRMRGVTRDQYERIVENVPRALDGRPRTREQLADRLAELAGPDVREAVLFSWGGVLKQSARRGDLCFGPPRGRNITFVRPDRWLRRTLRADPEEAGRDLARRYFGAYGPATLVDFGRWLENPTKGRELVRASADELVEVEVEGQHALALSSDLTALTRRRRPRGIRLLPAFDHYVTGTRPREAFVSSEQIGRVFGRQGQVAAVVLVDGRVAGTWTHERRGEVVRVEVEPFEAPPARVRKALTDEVERLAAFLGAPADLSVAA